MTDEKVKSPEEYANIEMNKKIGKAIANRQMKIKKLQEEIRKLKSGEMQPDAGEDDSSSSDKKKDAPEIIKERERIIPVPYPVREPRPYEPSPWKPNPYKPTPWHNPPLKYWISCNRKVYI